MRPIRFVAVSAVVLAVVAIWHLTVIFASDPKDANAARRWSSIDTMQMMKDARSLPVQQFEAN
jgi:succinate dehydrogenase hydrophobic anchor subunit